VAEKIPFLLAALFVLALTMIGRAHSPAWRPALAGSLSRLRASDAGILHVGLLPLEALVSAAPLTSVPLSFRLIPGPSLPAKRFIGVSITVVLWLSRQRFPSLLALWSATWHSFPSLVDEHPHFPSTVTASFEHSLVSAVSAALAGAVSVGAPCPLAGGPAGNVRVLEFSSMRYVAG